jgi:hypothetical protein
MIAPNWTQLKPGRFYHNLFRAAPPGYVSGMRQLCLRLPPYRTAEEPEDIHTPPVERDAHTIVVFRGDRDRFHSLAGWEEVLFRELTDLTRAHWLQRVEAFGPVEVAIHVRRGDFVEATSADDFIFRGGIRTPIQWFVRCLEEIRRLNGTALPAIVVSDASDAALAELLDLRMVTRAETGSAIGDLLVLSKAKVLIASGGSSFSAWAAYLGQMPAVAYPGQSLEWFNIVPMFGQFIGTWNPSQPAPPKLVQHLQSWTEAVTC